MNKKIIQKIIVAGVISKDGKILIIQRSANENIHPNLWEIPGGRRELLESTEDALIREVKEETSLDVGVVGLISVFDYQIEKPDEIRDATQINFLVKLLSGDEIKLSDDHQNFAWVSKDELNKYNLTEQTKMVLRKAFELISSLTDN